MHRNSEAWGVVFFFTGLWILIALISHHTGGNDNILGRVFGTALANGMVLLFGVIPGFIIPLLIITLSIPVFKGEELPFRELFYGVVFLFQLCILLSINRLPAAASESLFPVDSNAAGSSIVYLLSKIFGPHVFGPYLILFLTVTLTIVSALKIELKTVWNLISGFTVKLYRYISRICSSVSSRLGRLKKSEDPEESSETSSEGQSEPSNETEETDSPEQGYHSEEDKTEEEKNGEDETHHPDTVDQEIKIHYTDPEAGSEPSETEPSTEETHAPEQIVKPKGKPGKYRLPSYEILEDTPEQDKTVAEAALKERSSILEKTLENFGVEGKVVNISPGPIVTRYEIELAPGVKISKVVNLSDDIAMAAGGKKIRIQAPIPGKSAIGIELPNEEMQTVFFKDLLKSKNFKKTKAKLPIIIGRTISGAPFSTDISKMPHLLIAGQTGAGKSVGLNCFISSMLMTRRPEELRLILIDPKKVEMADYEGIPHLMAPVVTEAREAVNALKWAVKEMEERYRTLATVHARNIDSFNEKIDNKEIDNQDVLEKVNNKRLPYIVIIVDELADLMMTASKEVEEQIQRIAQLARAVGIHLVVATQRPSVDIITGPIKANLTSRIAFRTIQSTDSRTILGSVGAEKLLGQGDMLFLRSGAPDIERYHGAFISEKDVQSIANSIRSQGYEIEKKEGFSEDPEGDSGGNGISDSGEQDDKFFEAARLIVNAGVGSTSLIQRRLKLGYARAGRVMDELHDAGIVGPPLGSKPREVLLKPEALEQMIQDMT
ncbi:MAG: DNA translocase FtsK [Chitinivibrionales bacterium]